MISERISDELIQLGPDEPLLTVLSAGIGQDSTATLARLIEEPPMRQRFAPGRLIVVASDTGDEHEHTYKYIPYLSEMCVKAGAPFFWLTADKGFHSEAWRTLLHQWRRNSTVGIKAGKKSCTDNLKIQPIYRFLSHYLQCEFTIYVKGWRAISQFAQCYGKIRMIIGFAMDEEDRISSDSVRPQWHRESIEYSYPLIEWNWNRADCINYLRIHGYQVPYPSNCRHCPYSTELDVLLLARNDPPAFAEWVEMEQNKLAKFAHLGPRNYGVFGRESLLDVLSEATAKYAHLSDQELTELKFTRGHCVRSKY